MKRLFVVCAAIGLVPALAGHGWAQRPAAQFRNLKAPSVVRPQPGIGGYIGGPIGPLYGSPANANLVNPNLNPGLNSNLYNQNLFNQNLYNQNLYNQNLYNQNLLNPNLMNPYGAINPYGVNPYQVNPVNPFNPYSPAVMNAPFGNPFFFTPQLPQNVNPNLNPFAAQAANPLLGYAANSYLANPFYSFSPWQNPLVNPAMQWLLYQQQMYQNPAVFGLPPVGAPPIVGIGGGSFPAPVQAPK